MRELRRPFRESRHRRGRSLALIAAFSGVVAIALMGQALTGWAPDAHAQRSAPNKVIRLEAIQIEGRIQKPQAFYILQRSSLNIEVLELKESFIPKILKSVEQAPF